MVALSVSFGEKLEMLLLSSLLLRRILGGKTGASSVEMKEEEFEEKRLIVELKLPIAGSSDICFP